METMVSLFVIALVLLGLVYVQSAATLATAKAKQRQQATQLANRVVEQARAIPWMTLSAGLNSGDLGADPNISGGRFRPTYTTGIDEELVTSASQDQPPLYPHLQQVTLGNATYSLGIYLTKTAAWTATQPILWLSVVASRVSGPGSAFRPVALRTQVYSPDGCLSTSVRPYSGPCQAFFHGSAGTTTGRIWLDKNGADAVAELGVQRAQLTVPAVSVSGQAEQTTSLSSSAITSGISLQGSGGDASGGLVKARVTADDDPSSVLATNPAPVTVSQAASAAQSTGSFGAVTLAPSTSETAEAMVGENSGAAVPCRDTGDQLTSAGLPCASAKLTGLGQQSITVNPVPLAGRGLGTFTLAGLDPPTGLTSPGRAWAARLAQTQNGHCTALTATGTVGCSTAAASRGAGTLTLGALPAYNAADTPGWTSGASFQGMVSVTGYLATAASEQGIGAGAPAGTRTGSVSYWNGEGYSALSLTAAAVDQPLGTASIAYKSGSSTMTITAGGTITAEAVTTTAWPTPGCTVDACVTSTQVPSVIVRVTYDVQVDGVAVASFTVNADLGTVTASTSYRAAPSA
jgi:type II secretory pathway pseudopilin PulG